MKILFLIQGEGNGHLTQAISLFQMLTAEGHRVVGAMIGSSDGRKKPGFFCDSVNCPVDTYKSAGLSYSGDGRLKVGTTLARMITGIPDIYRSLRKIHAVVSARQPDLIVNFYEVCGGLYNVLYRNKIPAHCIAHQYLFLHPDFRFPPGKKIHRYGLTLLSKVTALKASGIYALSFSDTYPSTKKLTVAPPLLRREVRDLAPSNGNHLLFYLTQPLLRQRVEQWHRRNPTVVLHCFCNNPLQKTKLIVNDTLTFHPTDTDTFLDLLKSCRALVTTAGFETVCEAMLLGKPVMMVPVPDHYEQECNALDATLNGIGIAHQTFNPDYLLENLAGYQPQSTRAREWIAQIPARLVLPLTSSGAATGSHLPATSP